MKKYLQLIFQAIRGHDYDYTEGTVDRALLFLGIPMVLEMVMESLFAVTDVFFVAKLGKEAIATVGLTESIIMLVEAIAIGLCMAATALVSRRIGEKNISKANNTAFQSIVVTICTALILGLLGYHYAEDILMVMGADEKTIALGLGYTKIMFTLNITLMMLFMLNAIFRGAGDASIAMRTLWLANGLNIILDPCLIFGWGPFPEMGIEGAAIATNIGRGIGVLFQLYILFKGSAIVKITGDAMYLSWAMIKGIFKVAAGGAGQLLISTLSWVFMVRIVAIFGSAALAGYTIAFRIIVFSILPSWGLANATATLVGQNLGANKPERAEASVWRAAKLNAIFLAGIAILFFFLAEWLVLIFDQDPAVVYHGKIALQIICFGYISYSFGMIIGQAFNGAGDTKTPTLINFIAFWIIQIPLAYVLSITFGLEDIGVYIASGIATAVWAIVLIVIFKKGNWKTVEI